MNATSMAEASSGEGLLGGALQAKSTAARVRIRARRTSSPDFYFVLSEQGVYLDYGVFADSMLLIPPTRFLGLHITQVFPPDIATRFLTAMDQARHRHESVEVVHALQVDGMTRYYRAHFRFRLDRTFICFVFDLTATAHAGVDEEEDAADLRDFAHADRVALVARLAASLVHELGQPLGAMLANANAGRRLCDAQSPDPAAIGDVLADIVRSGEYASGVTERFRAFLRNEASHEEMLDLNRVVKDVALLARAELAGRRLKLELYLPPRRLRILADRIQLQQVVLNLVLNAAEAVRGRRPGTGVVSMRTARKKGGVELLVEDNGPGFAAAHLAGFFMPFVSHRPHGMGMGLAICEEIVRAHGGKLSATNPKGGGACVRVMLPTAHAHC